MRLGYVTRLCTVIVVLNLCVQQYGTSAVCSVNSITIGTLTENENMLKHKYDIFYNY